MRPPRTLNDLVAPPPVLSAIPDNVLGTFSDLPQLSQFWRHPNDKDVLKFGLNDLLNTTDSPPSKVVKTESEQTAAEARAISQLNTDAMKVALLLAYRTMETEIATSDDTGDVTQSPQVPTLALMDQIKSSLTMLGHSDTVVDMIMDGARNLLRYQQLRDERYKTVEKLKKDLERVTEVIAEISKFRNSPNVWQVPRLTLKDFKVVVVEDALAARERDQAEKAARDLKAIAAVAQDWKKTCHTGAFYSRTEPASGKDNSDPVESTTVAKCRKRTKQVPLPSTAGCLTGSVAHKHRKSSPAYQVEEHGA
ncbi:uncharacterized protein Z520_03199 [Fonsecaea multimorphosa CBS 102226]|uniref:Uncharacterized protein n=1 Tax=Fonsecaea multimorphosa CBS 102226 TaxID=1442371 RepID=A0A0D2HF41_9EURO|nr:uncharacterized protein Z520_03199 [Fonsecaea multimorphosa CBS 102226]KIY00536.1 hypothetical protein Z520_03199 [Fonsecaea multimorphosa CBS 102226]OAL18932.1 hypothetical protein AYO22_10261 [Fonsecaea multimorphosa]